MRCEFCRDPGHIPKAVEICRDCAPRVAAMEDVAEKAMAWPAAITKTTGPWNTAIFALGDACAALAKLTKPDGE